MPRKSERINSLIFIVKWSNDVLSAMIINFSGLIEHRSVQTVS